jgi:hypothetical protein
MAKKLSLEATIWKAIIDKDKLSEKEILEKKMTEPKRSEKFQDYEGFGLFDSGREPDLFG